MLSFFKRKGPSDKEKIESLRSTLREKNNELAAQENVVDQLLAEQARNSSRLAAELEQQRSRSPYGTEYGTEYGPSY